MIVPVFNRKDYIEKCLNSIVNQTFRNFELIVVDDGSDDGTGEICDEYGKRHLQLKVIHQRNEGVSKARNTGIKYAQGEYCTFIDSDDYLPLNYLQQFHMAYRKWGEEYIYLTSFRVFDENGIKFFRYRKGVRYSAINHDGIIELINKGLFNSACNKFYKLSLLKEKNIYFPKAVDLGEDLIFNLKYLDKQEEFHFLALNKVMYNECWNKKNSLEQEWRYGFFEIKKKLLQEKKKYINKWINEGKLSQRCKLVFSLWDENFINENIRYYVRNIRKMDFLQIMKRVSKIIYFENSYTEVGKKKLLKILCNILKK